jgi:peroxiredoxin family protein
VSSHLVDDRRVNIRVVFFWNTGGFQSAWQVLSLALTAAAMGKKVTIVAAFEALEALSRGEPGGTKSVCDEARVRRGLEIGAPTPAAMLTDLRALGGRIIACETAVQFCNLDPDALRQAGVLDDVLGLPQIWKETEAAQTLTF